MQAAMKCFVHCMIFAFGTWISAYTLGSTADELIGWFDEYSDKTKTEGTDTNTNEVAVDGTSIEVDLLYHSITALYSYVVLSSMWLGGYWFVNNFSPYGVYLGPDCDLDQVSASTYSSVQALTPTLREKSYAECQTAITNAFNTVDLDGNGIVSMCEDAKYLRGIGNTKEYAMSYPNTYSLKTVQDMCAWIVPDAFDDIQQAAAAAPELSLID